MNSTINLKGLRGSGAAALCGLIASSFAALPAASDSFASNSFAPPTIRVKFGDLDVSRPQGAAVLYGRIQAAAVIVCSAYETRDLAAKPYLDACIHEAISKAVTMVDAPALSLVYSTKTRTSLPTHHLQ